MVRVLKRWVHNGEICERVISLDDSSWDVIKGRKIDDAEYSLFQEPIDEKNIKYLPKINGDIYVIGSGKSLDFINRDFFRGKISIGVNYAYKHFDVTYSMSHHYHLVQDMIDSGVSTITSEFEMGLYDMPKHNFNGNYHYYKHRSQEYLFVNTEDFDNPESLVCGGTITISAMHLAYKLGAESIILCGIDGGFIDQYVNYGSYNDPTNIDHPGAVQPQLELIANKIRECGIGVYSINPFVNLRLEGHTFTT